MLEEVRDLFLNLVQLDSHSLEEADVAAFCRTYLEALGFSVREDDAGNKLGGNTGNLIATLAGDADLPRVMLTAHMDTVQPGQRVKPRVDDDGVVWSDGSTVLGADDKAGVTAVLLGLKQLIDSTAAHGNITVVLTIAEEIGLQGAKALNPASVEADFGLALDSGGPLGTIVTAGPSQVRWEAEFIGKPAHAGVAPENGISAIRVAARAVSNMQHGRIDAETTVNIGSFLAEGPNNVVRDRVRLIGEARSRNPEKLAALLKDMEAGFDETAVSAGAAVTFSHSLNYDGFRFTESEPVRRHVERVLTELGHPVNAVEGGGGSDANIFTSIGIPTINVGIGYAEIHSTSEHVALADIAGAARIVTTFCTRWP